MPSPFLKFSGCEKFIIGITRSRVTSSLSSLPDNVEVDVTSIPVAKKKANIRETHKTKAFYIRNDIAKLIDKDIRNSRRGAMTEIVNALFEEYYKSQGRL